MNKKTSSSNNAAKMSSPTGHRTWHGMGARTALAALLGMGLVSHTASGEVVLFSDNFTVSAESYNDNFENTLGRQSGGTLGVINYTAAGSGAAYTQVGHSYCPGAMLLAGGGATSPDHNFTENPGIGGVSFVRFLADPVLPLSGNQDPVNWMGLTLGTSLAKRNLAINTTDGFAIVFRGNGGFIAYDGATAIGNGTYTTATNGFNPVEIRIAGPMDGNPWDGANGTLIAVFADGKADPFFCYRKTGVGYTNNYITLLGYGGSTATHGVDDFQVGTDATAVASNMSLKVDFQAAANLVTQLGFFDFNQNDAGSATYPTAAGDVTVAVSGQSGFFNRGGVVNSGNLTFADVYNDFVYKNGAALTSPQSLTLTLSGVGILPNKRYRLTFYSYDDLIGSAHSVSFSGASGTTGSAGPLLYTSNQDPTSNSAYSVTGFFKANSSGTLTVLATDTFSGSSGIRLNAFEIVSDFLPKGTMVSFH